MNCREIAEFLNDYVAGTLPDAIHSEFEEHLALCPDCQAYLDGYRKTIALLGELSRAAAADAPPAPEDLIQAILAARQRH
ncbi:anti-sigma factor family protein [Tuwongella immobilis]|uniref:Putative zinc-finger domain-containing protein n=1 Tax=Tuwongella immobilis TaxID=692036 RepID=A0A6C2YJ78_9BACT|nr:zf-HC2 domain-containing protein [Tuwongella immobilis]VIP01608.1 Uncharacterized protein OS=Planctomyces limnophilus (strain ATCC 43296 / DSM 3776 / IFAM 1008 / 290) GN=Plim_3810 PE=4 SV=1: zf-HC2 [Tuwongella immobilis]VTR98913.1 Uncharacterized protein OS=Planctomyces limnophilus (strain ATCC 43296 / DSM 3776 / IFAM 1008 / 290) GN=Plim_3810 PE=4 SV=1: zf-HC2 [Tuwongella immobilis]